MSSDSDASLPDRRNILTKNILERENLRLAENQKRKEEADKVASKTETTSYFVNTLTTGITTITDGLKLASQQPKENLISYFDDLSSKLAELQKFVTDSAMFLSSYDLGHRQQQLNDLQSEIASCRNTFLPKKKFAFKNKNKETALKDDTVAPPVSGKSEITRQQQQPVKESGDTSATVGPTQVDVHEYRIDNVEDQQLSVTADLILGKDVIVSSLKSSTLKITGLPSAMHLTDLSDSIVLSGPCARSVFIERCSNCVLVLACQQLRIHEAINCTFFIHVTSKAIIEDSKDLKFAPYQLTYKDIDAHYKESGLNKNINNWHDVDDFNWLVRDKQSPNWSILPEEERISHNIN